MCAFVCFFCVRKSGNLGPAVWSCVGSTNSHLLNKRCINAPLKGSPLTFSEARTTHTHTHTHTLEVPRFTLVHKVYTCFRAPQRWPSHCGTPGSIPGPLGDYGPFIREGLGVSAVHLYSYARRRLIINPGVEVKGRGWAISLTVVYNYHGVHVNTVSNHASTRLIFFTQFLQLPLIRGRAYHLLLTGQRS